MAQLVMSASEPGYALISSMCVRRHIARSLKAVTGDLGGAILAPRPALAIDRNTINTIKIRSFVYIYSGRP